MARKFFSLTPIRIDLDAQIMLVNMDTLVPFITTVSSLDKNMKDSILNVNFSSEINGYYPFVEGGQSFDCPDVIDEDKRLITNPFVFDLSDKSEVRITYKVSGVYYDVKFDLLEPDIKIPKSAGSLLRENGKMLGVKVNGWYLGVFTGYPTETIDSFESIDDLNESMELHLHCAVVNDETLDAVFYGRIKDLYINFRIVFDRESTEVLRFFCTDSIKYHFFDDNCISAEEE